DAAGGSNVVGEWLPGDAATLDHAGERIVDLIDGPNQQERGKVAVTFGAGGHRVRGRRRQCVLHSLVGEHEEYPVAAVDELGDADRAGEHSAVLIEAAYRLPGAGFIGEERRGVESGVLV